MSSSDPLLNNHGSGQDVEGGPSPGPGPGPSPGVEVQHQDEPRRPASLCTPCCICVLFTFIIIGLSCVALAVFAAMIGSAVFIPPLIAALIIVRVSQVFRGTGHGLNRTIQLKYLIKSWTYVCVVIWIITSPLLSVIVKHDPNLKRVVLAGLTLNSWIDLTFALSLGFVVAHLASINFLVYLPRIPMEYKESGISFPDSVAEIVYCLLLWYVGLRKVVKTYPVLTQHETILGLETSKWIETAIFTLIGYNAITISTCLLVCLLQKACRYLDPKAQPRILKYVPSLGNLLHRQHLVYYANGTRRSFDFILTSVMLLLIWSLYFGSHLDKNIPTAASVLRFGYWSFASLVICSVLWLLKTCVVLAWEARTVYDRLESEILDLGKQVHFLGLVGRKKCDHPSHQVHERGLVEKRVAFVTNAVLPALDLDLDKHEPWCSLRNHEINITKLPKMRIPAIRKRFPTGKKTSDHPRQDDFCISSTKPCEPTMYDVQQVAQYLLGAQLALFNYNPRINELPPRVTRVDLQNLVKGENDPATEDLQIEHDWEYFERLVESRKPKLDSGSSNNLHSTDPIQGDSSQGICFTDLQAWTKNARGDGLLLINTISSSMEMVDCLDKIMSWVIIGATFILWLLLTKIASTNILVLIVSPVLAASFVFGETCKNLFQGIIFVYILEPFSVGDECDIGGDEKMRVTSIGVWKTIFSKNVNGKNVQVVYPNSELARQKVINYKANLGQPNQQTTTDANHVPDPLVPTGSPRMHRSSSF